MITATINYYRTGDATPISQSFKVAQGEVARMITARFNISPTSMLKPVDYASVTYSDGCRYTVIRDDVKGIRFVDHREY